MPTLVQEAGWCPGCNSRLRAAGEESRLGGSCVYETGQWPESSHWERNTCGWEEPEKS